MRSPIGFHITKCNSAELLKNGSKHLRDIKFDNVKHIKILKYILETFSVFFKERKVNYTLLKL